MSNSSDDDTFKYMYIGLLAFAQEAKTRRADDRTCNSQQIFQ